MKRQFPPKEENPDQKMAAMQKRIDCLEKTLSDLGARTSMMLKLVVEGLQRTRNEQQHYQHIQSVREQTLLVSLRGVFTNANTRNRTDAVAEPSVNNKQETVVSGNTVNTEKLLEGVDGDNNPGPSSKKARIETPPGQENLGTTMTNNSTKAPAPSDSARSINDMKRIITEFEGEIARDRDAGKMTSTIQKCRGVSVGNYKVTSPEVLNFGVRVAFSELGIFFTLPHRETGTIRKCTVPADKILAFYGNFHGDFAVCVVVCRPKIAELIREQLGISSDKTGNIFYCPLNGDATQRHLTFLVSPMSKIEAAKMRKLYGQRLVEWDEVIAKLFLEAVGFLQLRLHP